MYLAYETPVRGGCTGQTPTEAALTEFELLYAYIYSRVGNRADAEDLTQQVALKALSRLREGSSSAEVRGYLYATARSVLSAFWAERYRLPESELSGDEEDDGRGGALEAPARAVTWLEHTLAALPPHYRQVLELRYLSECSLREVASEMGKTVGAVKLMQLRALRAAAAIPPPAPGRWGQNAPEPEPAMRAVDHSAGGS